MFGKVSSLEDALERVCEEERAQGREGHVLFTTIPCSCVNQGNANTQLWLLRLERTELNKIFKSKICFIAELSIDEVWLLP